MTDRHKQGSSVYEYSEKKWIISEHYPSITKQRSITVHEVIVFVDNHAFMYLQAMYSRFWSWTYYIHKCFSQPDGGENHPLRGASGSGGSGRDFHLRISRHHRASGQEELATNGLAQNATCATPKRPASAMRAATPALSVGECAHEGHTPTAMRAWPGSVCGVSELSEWVV